MTLWPDNDWDGNLRKEIHRKWRLKCEKARARRTIRRKLSNKEGDYMQPFPVLSDCLNPADGVVGESILSSDVSLHIRKGACDNFEFVKRWSSGPPNFEPYKHESPTLACWYFALHTSERHSKVTSWGYEEICAFGCKWDWYKIVLVYKPLVAKSEANYSMLNNSFLVSTVVPWINGWSMTRCFHWNRCRENISWRRRHHNN